MIYSDNNEILNRDIIPGDARTRTDEELKQGGYQITEKNEMRPKNQAEGKACEPENDKESEVSGSKTAAIDIKSRRIAAMDNFLKGYNCTQSVVLAFSDLIDIDQDTLMKLSCSFGGGMGRLREVCGSVSGMFIVAGLLYGYSGPETGDVKKEHYARIQALAHSFEEKHGSIVCRELLGLGVKHDEPQPEARTLEYYKKRPCREIIGDAAEILAEFINLQEKT